MSCGVAIKSGDTVYVGADSLFANNTISISKEEQCKIWKINDFGIVFAHSGFIVDMNIISMSDEIFDESFKGQAIQFKDVVNKIVPNMMSVLEKRGRIEYMSGIKQMKSHYILAHKDKVFSIEMDGCVIEPEDDYISIGSGKILAEGAFQVIKDDTRYTPQQKIVKILTAVCTKEAWVNYPIRVFNTKNDDIIIIRNEEESNKFTKIKSRKK